MLNSIRCRLDRQGGFTLIELLVVMIIIAILMAVAVPVFLGQKQKALATQAKTNVKHVQDTIESCAAGTTNGALSQAGLNCATMAQVLLDEQSLTPVVTSAAAMSQCPTAPPCVTITPMGTMMYTLVGKTTDNTAGFTLIRTDTSVFKSCSASNPNNKARMCPTGSW